MAIRPGGERDVICSPAPRAHIFAIVQTLLSPLPPGARITRRPVASEEVLGTESGAALAGWEQIVAELSEGGTLRIAMVVVDAKGRLLSVNDTVTTMGTSTVRAGTERVPATLIESAGGRIERDGSIRGTRWTSRTVDDETATAAEPSMESVPAALGDGDVAALRALAAELVRRGGGPSAS